MDLDWAISEFRKKHPRASDRQVEIQRYCCQELKARGIPNAEIEVVLPGVYRNKKWDVGVLVDGEPRLGISCKSIVSNHGGTVPNRIDDLLGEGVNLHRRHPKAVLGWLFMMSRIDESKYVQKRTAELGGMTPERRTYLEERGDIWFERLVKSVTQADQRSGPNDFPEKFEAVSFSQIEFDKTPINVRIPKGAKSPDQMFDDLAKIYFQRFP